MKTKTKASNGIAWTAKTRDAASRKPLPTLAEINKKLAATHARRMALAEENGVKLANLNAELNAMGPRLKKLARANTKRLTGKSQL